MLISIHLPKTGGSSFYGALQAVYSERLLKDDGDKPINTPTLRRNSKALVDSVVLGFRDYGGVDCIHGHFMPVKYLGVHRKQRVSFITWLRDPVERLASHYYYWTRNYDHDKAGKLRRKVVEDNWSLERFCLGPELKNVYGQFLWGFPLRRMNFIGITEYYDEDFSYFAETYLKAKLEIQTRNVNPYKSGQTYITDPDFRAKIEKHHSKDMALYRSALELRLQRLAS